MLKRIIKSSLFRNTGIYTITSIINVAIPFFLLPILTRYLTPEDYGIVSMFTMLTSVISPFIGLSVNGAISRKYYDREDTDIWAYVFNGILLISATAIIVSLVFYVFAGVISKISYFPVDSLWMVIAVVVSQIIVSILLSLWQVQKKARNFGLFLNLKTLTNLIMSIIFVMSLQLGWQGRIYGHLLTDLIFAVIAIVIIYRNQWIKASFNKDYIKHALMFGLPLIPHALSGTIISMSDRFFITNMVGLAATGIYTVGYQVGAVVNLFASSFNNAYVPWLYERLKKNEYSTKVKIVKFTYLYFIGIILAAIVLGYLAPIFLSVFLGKSFNESSTYVIWIALGYAFNGMYLMVVNYIFFAQKTGSLAMVTFATSMINLVLNFFFIKAFGAVGAAQATTVVYAIKFIMVWILSAKVHKMPWNLKSQPETA